MLPQFLFLFQVLPLPIPVVSKDGIECYCQILSGIISGKGYNSVCYHNLGRKKGGLNFPDLIQYFHGTQIDRIMFKGNAKIQKCVENT